MSGAELQRQVDCPARPFRIPPSSLTSNPMRRQPANRGILTSLRSQPSADQEALFLLGPVMGQGAGQGAQREIGRGGAVGDRFDDAR